MVDTYGSLTDAEDIYLYIKDADENAQVLG